MTEDERVEWHHRLNGHESEHALGVGDGREAWCVAVHRVSRRYNLGTEQQQQKDHQSYISVRGILNVLRIFLER